MIRLLVVGHAYVVAENRQKFPWINEADDIEVYVLAPEKWNEPEFGTRVLGAEAESYPVFGLPVRFNGHVRRTYFHSGKLARVFDEVRPHVVQIEQEPASLMAWQCVRAARRRGARVVLFTWDNVDRKHRFPLGYIERYCLARADRVLAGNEAARELVARKGHGDKVEVLPQTGIELPAAARASEPEGFVVGFAGRLVERKGVLDLLDAFADLDEAANLVFVGDGPAKTALVERAENAGVRDRVFFEGNLSRNETAVAIGSMSVLVLPSRTTGGWAEQFGHVLVEAMAAGVPVVGSDSGAIPGVIGEAGVVFPEGDTAALTGALRSLMENAMLRRERGDAGGVRALERFTNDAIARRTVGIVRELAGTE